MVEIYSILFLIHIYECWHKCTCPPCNIKIFKSIFKHNQPLYQQKGTRNKINYRNHKENIHILINHIHVYNISMGMYLALIYDIKSPQYKQNFIISRQDISLEHTFLRSW